MKFLKTFFGEVLRKNDIDFESQAVRDINVQSHIDFSNSLGGVVNGLDVYASLDGLSINITPGVFYTSGQFNSLNGFGGGERVQIYTQQTITNLPTTAPYGLAPSYAVVYAKSLNVPYDPDPTQSQAIVTSKNLQTGLDVPVRQYTAGTVVVSSPITLDQISSINGVVLAVIQVDYVGLNQQSNNGVVQVINSSYKQPYVVGGSVDLLNQRLVSGGVPDGFITSRMLGSGSITTGKFSDGAITSSKVAVWDGSSTDAFSGSGIATAHLKDGAVTAAKLSVTGSMSGFSAINYIENGSFEKDSVGSSSVTDWSIYNPSSSGTVTVSNAYSQFGSNSVLLNGFLNPGPPATSQAIGIQQIINLTGNQINNRDVCAFFYLKTDSAFPLSISGTNGIYGTVEFLSQGATIGSPVTFAGYSGPATDWTKLQTEEPIVYSGSSSIDGLRLSITGSFVNVNAYIDGVFVGLTNLIPSWSPAASDGTLGDTLNIANINTLNLSATNASLTNASTTNLTVQSMSALTSGVSTVGTLASPFGAIYTDSLIIGGSPFNFGQNMQVLPNTTSWQVPLGVTAVTVEMIAGGGGGAGGALCGGGAGEYVKATVPVTIGELLTVYVGTGGLPGGPGNGGTGSDSFILNHLGVELIRAHGGAPGTSTGGAGGGGSAITSSSVRSQGQTGGTGNGQGGNAAISFFGGVGGSSTLGINAAGSGAGGGSDGTNGGSGAPGLVVITW